jgi:hypothetical protein
MSNEMTQRPHDDPFEWLGQGIIMDQSNHAEQNPMNILPVNGSVSEEATDLMTRWDKVHWIKRTTWLSMATNLLTIS